jgi:YD repeat-containing protein
VDDGITASLANASAAMFHRNWSRIKYHYHSFGQMSARTFLIWKIDIDKSVRKGGGG